MGSGRVLAGRYRLLRALGSGGMGTVWLALDEVLHRQVAVKEVSPPADVSENEREMLRERTLREARTAARLSHPNVVTIYDVVEDGNQPWIVMELGPGRSLRDIVEQDGPLTVQQAARIALQVLAALRAAHFLGIMHRDVKPGNVLIDADERVVLADFGIARAQDSPATTMSGVIVGSPSYIAPERARGERGGPESDLWSLGATLYAAVEGRPPYDRAGALATLTAVVTEDPDPPSRSGQLWPVIRGLLCRDQAQRLGPDDAERMLRHVAEADEPSQTAPLRTPSEFVYPAAAPAPPGGRLEHAERIRAFHPHGTQPAALPQAAAASASPPIATGEDTTATPPTGFAMRQEQPQTEDREPRPEPSDEPAPEPAIAARQAPHPAPGPAAGEPPPAPEPLAPEPLAPEPLAPQRREGRGTQRRPRLAWVIAAAAALVAVAGALLGLTLGGHHVAQPPTRPDHSAGSAAASNPATSGPRPSPAGPATSAPAAPPSAGGPTSAPAGYHVYRDPTGFSIAVPNGWAVSHQGVDVYLSPPSGARFFLIDQSSQPKPDPLADWRQQEANRIGTYPGYRRIRLEAINYPQAEKAADWEFTYYRQGVLTHVLNRNVLANSTHAYALYWSTPASQWAQSLHIFEVFARTFQPAAP